MSDRIEQILRHAGAFEDESHEGEKRNRQQGVVADDAEDAFGQRRQQIPVERDDLIADAFADAGKLKTLAVGRKLDAHEKKQKANGGE